MRAASAISLSGSFAAPLSKLPHSIEKRYSGECVFCFEDLAADEEFGSGDAAYFFCFTLVAVPAPSTPKSQTYRPMTSPFVSSAKAYSPGGRAVPSV